MKALGYQALKQYAVNRAGDFEEIAWSLYDFTTYAAAGQTVLTLFQSPLGQNGKTIIDTNLDSAGSVPKGQNFMVQAVSVEFFPGVSIEAVAMNDYVDDVQQIIEGGALAFTVGSKRYINQSPLGLFPPTYGQEGYSAMTTAAQSVTYGRNKGKLYEIIPVDLVSNQNFKVELTWPTVVALPSGVAGRIGVRFHGRLYRNVQ